MTSTRGNWLRFLLAGLSIAAAHAGAPFAWAQGFGPDPFQPYNSQYDPYVYPMGPASPGTGPGGTVNERGGVRGANQWEAYQNELAGTARAGAEKYGIGMPYYRAAVDSRFDTAGKREYRPNRKADQKYEKTQELITQKYLAYFTERDPKKRAALVRDYSQTRRLVSRALSARGEAPSRILDEAIQLDADRRSRPTARGRNDDLGGNGVSTPRSAEAERSGSDAAREGSSSSTGRRAGSIPPPPPLPPGAAVRSSQSRRTPSEVLNRAQRGAASDDLMPGTGAGSATRRPARPGSTPPPTPPSD
jgi:hypothetical protein